MRARTAAVGICSALLFCAAHAQDRIVQLKIANYFPPPSAQSKTTQAFGEELMKRSGGRIKVEHYAGGSLLTGPNMYKGIESGIADIGYSHVYYTPGRMPVMEAVGLPIGIPNGWTGSQASFDFYKQFRPKEFAGVHVLSMQSTGPSLVISRRPVARLEDLKGLTIRAPGITGEVAKALGATPTPTPMMEVYDSISKGVNDAVWAPVETLKTFRFAEVAKNVTVNWQVGTPFPFYLVMNKRSYEGLTPQLRSIVDEVANDYHERFALMWHEVDQEGRAFAKDKGVTYFDLSGEEAARWQMAVEPVIADYVKHMSEKGYPAAQSQRWIGYLRASIRYWSEQQSERKIAR